MSKIPYHFDTPPPAYFREHGWYKSDNAFKFIHWAFARCMPFKREIAFDGKNIILEPYQFIFGRFKCSIETNMSEGEVRTQTDAMERAGFLSKQPSPSPHRFTIYAWNTTAFSQCQPSQQPSQQPIDYHSKHTSQIDNEDSTTKSTTKSTTNQQPSNNHKTEEQNTDCSKQQQAVAVFFDCLLEDKRLNDENRLALMRFKNERVILAIEYSKHVPTKTTLIQLLVWHCSQAKAPPIPKKPKNLSKELQKHFHHGNEYNGAVCYYLDGFIAFQRGSTNLKAFMTSEEDVKKILDRFEIKFDYEWTQN